jgi:predicted MFS family arabinose efflux permease
MKILQRIALIALIVFTGVSIFLWKNKKMISPNPWNSKESLGWFNYATRNNERLAVIQNSESTVIVMNLGGEFIYRLDASTDSFSNAEFAVLDEDNNLYILDKNFGGAFAENTERVLKFSSTGRFIEETYVYQYINKDFIFTKGKLCGMAYGEGTLYVVRLEDDGFYLEGRPVNSGGQNNTIFFKYPNAFRDLVYGRINIENQRLTMTTKARGIQQYNFTGTLLGEWFVEEGALPWSAVTDDNGVIIYADVASGELVSFNPDTKEHIALYSKPEGSPLAYINYTNKMLLAVSDDDLLLKEDGKDGQIVSSYTYTPDAVQFRMALFALGIFDALLFLFLITVLIISLRTVTLSETLKRIFLVGLCVAFGAGISSLIIITKMNERYYENIYTDLENVSHLIASSVDIGGITSIVSPAQYESEEYRRLVGILKGRFAQLPFNGMQVYQYIWMPRDGMVYSMYDSESALGTLYPFFEYEDSYIQEVFDTKQYVYTNDITAAGSWIFACGPIFDSAGKVAAVIETGYSMTAVVKQTQNMIIQTILIVIATTIAFLLIMIEFILIGNAYRQNKMEWSEDTVLPFRPELLRGIVFFQFFAANLATAFLPIYADRLYEPLFGLPKELVITFPFTANVIMVILSQLAIPGILKKLGLQRTGFFASLLFVAGNGFCFIAQNVVHLSMGYALIGFSGGTLVMVLNTVIGSRREVEEVNSGFAHYNASFLAGVNVGVVFGSIVAQFFTYRIVFLFAALFSVVLLTLYVFSTRSKYLRHFYQMTREEPMPVDYEQDDYKRVQQEKKFALLKFMFNPVVLVTLFMILLPYVASMSFTEYFLPIFGIDNGLTESNIGQLILLSGLFAILFGTSLCEYFSARFPFKIIVAFSIILTIGAVYLFSLYISIPMMLVAVVIIAIASIFALTNIQTYYSTLYKDTLVPSITALSVYAMVENLAMAVGPVVFSYILSQQDLARGLQFFAAVMLVCLVIFVVVSGIFGRKRKSRAV